LDVGNFQAFSNSNRFCPNTLNIIIINLEGVLHPHFFMFFFFVFWLYFLDCFFNIFVVAGCRFANGDSGVIGERKVFEAFKELKAESVVGEQLLDGAFGGFVGDVGWRNDGYFVIDEHSSKFLDLVSFMEFCFGNCNELLVWLAGC
jgi:hypothetical protein